MLKQNLGSVQVLGLTLIMGCAYVNYRVMELSNLLHLLALACLLCLVCCQPLKYPTIGMAEPILVKIKIRTIYTYNFLII